MIYTGTERLKDDLFAHADLSDLPGTVTLSVKRLKPYRHKFDSIAVQGMSGVIVGSPVCVELGKPLVVVRKPFDFHHGPTDEVMNDQYIGDSYLFLDDFIGTAATFCRVKTALDGIAEYAGYYLYSPDELQFDGVPYAAV